MNPDVLIIGTGITGALSATFLLRRFPSSNVIIWDKARGAGGRMSRSYSPFGRLCGADLGAQYITTDVGTIDKYKEVYEPLIREKVIETLSAKVKGMKKYESDTMRHFVAPDGMNSVVKFFLRRLPDANVKYNAKVIAIEEDGDKFAVKSECFSCKVDVVISTIPVPQFLQLAGTSKNYALNERDLLDIDYSSRYALIFFYDGNTAFPDIDWACQYFDHPVFRYVSIDNMKRNRPTEPVSITFHTSVTFGRDNIERNTAEIEEILIGHARALFPAWPEPVAVKCHKWKFSQVVKPFPGRPGCLLLNRKPTLILGGDAFSESNFDGCIYSSLKIVDALECIFS